MHPLTPTQVRLHSERQQRLARLRAHAVPDHPIRMLSASQRSALLPPQRRLFLEPPVPVVEASCLIWSSDQEREEEDQPLSEIRTPRVDMIQTIVARNYDIDRIALLSPRRTKLPVRARQVAMYLCKLLTFRSLPDIGRRFGGRDHTTAMHAIRKIGELAIQDEMFALQLAGLMFEIGRAA